MKKIALVVLVLFIVVGTCIAQAPAQSAKAEVKAKPKVTYLKTLGHYPLIPGGSSTSAEARRAFRVVEKFITKTLAEVAPKGDVGKQLAVQLFDTDFLDQAVFYNRPVNKGDVFPWMIYQGGMYLTDVMWVGDDPMQTFAFRVRLEGKDYEFAIPKVCGNVCLLGVRPVDPFVASTKPTAPVTVEQIKTEVVAPPKVQLSKDDLDEERGRAVYAAWKQRERESKKSNFKLSFGYGFGGGLSAVGPGDFRDEHSFSEYLWQGRFFGCEEGDSGFYYSEFSFPYRSGDFVLLGAKRVMTTSYRSLPISIGLEARVVGDFWLGVNYSYSGKLHVSFMEELTQMKFNDVQYLGYYPNTATYVWFLSLSRWQSVRQTEYGYSAHELDLTARYEVRIGDRFNLVPFVGLGVNLVSREVADQATTTITDPWSNQVQSISENLPFTETEHGSYVFGVAGLSAELRLLRGLWLSAEVTYRVIPKVGLGFNSLASEGSWSVRTDLWRITVNAKIVI